MTADSHPPVLDDLLLHASWVRALARHLGVPLALLTAVPSPKVADLSYVPDTIDASHQASVYLKDHVDRLRSEGLEVTELVVADRGAAHAILSQADGDLVVMSTHGRTGFDRVLFGSVADKVIRGATGAVMAIPPHTKDRHNETEQVTTEAVTAA